MDEQTPEPEDWRAPYGGLIGGVVAIVLALGAIWMLERMRSWATLGDCAFTHSPRCRELIKE
jgi:hypothetical protein